MQGGVRLTERPMHGLAAEDHPDEARRAEVGDGEGAIRAEEGAGRGRHPALERVSEESWWPVDTRHRCAGTRRGAREISCHCFVCLLLARHVCNFRTHVASQIS